MFEHLLRGEFLIGAWQENHDIPRQRIYPYLVKKRGSDQKTFDVSISGKSNDYKGFSLEEFLGLLAKKEYTEHSSVRMKPLTNNSGKGNGWLIKNIEFEDEAKQAIQALSDEATVPFQTIDKLEQAFQEAVENARKLSRIKREEKLRESDRLPQKVKVETTAYIRNPYVVAAVLERAKGACERCKNSAPFARRSDGSPYLEVHHMTPLSMNGEDTVSNAIALCPNCHRELHFGKNA